MTNPDYLRLFNGRSKLVVQSLSRYLLYFVTPGYYIYWTAFVFPVIVKYFKMNAATLLAVFTIQTFCFINAFANMVLSIPPNQRPNVPLSISQADCQNGEQLKCDLVAQDEGKATEPQVQASKPAKPRSKRHAILFVIYVALSSWSGAFWSGMYFLSKLGPSKLASELVVYASPFPCIHIINPCMAFLVFSYMGVIIVGPIALLHIWNLLVGAVPFNSSRKATGLSHWRNNLQSVFGKNWVAAVVWPFADSPVID